MIRLDLLATILTLFASILALNRRDHLSSSLAALSIAITFRVSYLNQINFILIIIKIDFTNL